MIRHLTAALVLALPAAAHEFRAGGLTIEHPVIYAAPPTAKAAAGYLTIRNDGEAAERLTGVTVEGAAAEFHRSEMEDGVMTMSPVEAIDVPAGGEAALAPGGFHVMITGLPEGPAEGASLDGTLTFERAGEVAITFSVESRPDGDHSDH